MWLWVVPVNEKIKQPNFSNVDLDPVEAAVLIPALVKYHFCANLLALVLSIKGTVHPKLKILSVSIHPRAEFGRSFVVHKTFLELHSVVGLHLHCNIVIKMQLFCPSHHMIIPVIPPPQVEAVSTDGATPLFNSCSSGSAACVRLLLQHGASLHTSYQLASPIHEAAKKGVCMQTCTDEFKGIVSKCTGSHAVPFSGHRECLELLLSYGAHIDMELPVVGTPLYSACMARAAASVGLLLHSGTVACKLHCTHPTGSEKVEHPRPSTSFLSLRAFC